MELLAVFVVYSRQTGMERLCRRQAQEPSFKSKVPFRGRVRHTIPPISAKGLDFPKYTPRLCLYILNQISWLTFQEGADCIQRFPGYQFTPPELLKVRLPNQLFFTDAGGGIALLLQFCQNIHLVLDCHKIRLLFHHPYSIIELHLYQVLKLHDK